MIAEQSHLSKYIPQSSLSTIRSYLNNFKISLFLAKPRKSKLGDYRPPRNGKGHRISVNEDLNPYAFLLTLVHEIAHAYTFQQYGPGRVAPHGKEWQRNFSKLMQPFLNKETFPTELLPTISQHLTEGRATSCTDPELTTILKKYDQEPTFLKFIYELPFNETFIWRNGKQFVKQKKLRKRYRCREVDTGYIYLFSPVAEVQPLGRTQ